MTPRQGVNRFAFRFGQALKRNDKSFKIFQEDIDALKSVAEYVERKEKQQLIDNQLFGKLYIYLYGELVRYYRATALDDIPQKELHKILDKPLRIIVEETKDKLNDSEFENVIKKTKDWKDYEPMQYDEVAENFKAMINGAINTYVK